MAISTALLRAVPGAFILNSGIGKLGLDEAKVSEALQTAHDALREARRRQDRFVSMDRVIAST